MIKVMHILSDSNIGGAGRYVADAAAAMDRGTFAMSVAVPAGAEIMPLIDPGIRVWELGQMEPDRSYSWNSLLALFILIRKQKPDIVHTHASLAGRIAARLNGVGIVYTRHTAGPLHPQGSIRWQINRFMNRLLADRAIAVSDYMAEYIEQEGLPPAMIKRIYNGIDTERFSREAYDPEHIKRERGLEGKTICTVLGRLEPVKGHQRLMEAWERVCRSQVDSVLLVIGEGSQREDLEMRIKAAGLGETVIFTGALADVRPCLAISDVLVMPSLDETFGLALIEAMSMSVACIATSVGGMPEIISDGQNGLLVPSQDSDSLAEALVSLMTDPEQRLQMGIAARKTVEERFSLKRMAEELSELYRSVLANKGHGVME